MGNKIETSELTSTYVQDIAEIYFKLWQRLAPKYGNEGCISHVLIRKITSNPESSDKTANFVKAVLVIELLKVVNGYWYLKLDGGVSLKVDFSGEQPAFEIVYTTDKVVNNLAMEIAQDALKTFCF